MICALSALRSAICFACTPEVPYKTKLAYYGEARIDVGGASPAASKDDPVPKPAELVPQCYHSMSADLYDEIIHSYCLTAIIDLTCNDGILAEVCVRKRMPYMGVCLSDTHKEAIEKRVCDRTFHNFQEEGDLYQAELVEFGKKRKASEETASTPGTKKSRSSGSSPADRKPKATEKKAASKAAAAKSAASKLLEKLRALGGADPEEADDSNDEDPAGTAD